MKALRQCVERVVRPLRASQQTKDRMRAELLEHLELLYQQEVDRSGDGAAALDKATRRFGEPRALTSELQASVPRLEQWAFLPLPGTCWGQRRRHESISAWILRTTTAGALASGASIALVVLFLAAFEHRLHRLVPVSLFLLVTPVLVWFSLVSLYGCCELIRRELMHEDTSVARLRRWARVAALTILSMGISATAPAILAVMARMTVPQPFFSNRTVVAGCLGWGLVMGAILAIQVRDWSRSVRRFEEWESIDLDAEPTA